MGWVNLIKKKTRIFALIAAALAILMLIISAADSVMRARRKEAVINAVLQTGAEFDVSPALILAVILVESDFEPNAVSAVGACGLMQLMPETYRFIGTELLDDPQPDSAIFTLDVNIRFGARYLRYLLEKFKCLDAALAAYNAGEGRVLDWLREAGGQPGDPLAVIPFPETAAYVENVLAAYARYNEKYNFKEF